MGLLHLSFLLLVSALSCARVGTADAHEAVDIGHAFGQQPLQHGVFADMTEPSSSDGPDVSDDAAADPPDAADTPDSSVYALQSLAISNTSSSFSFSFSTSTGSTGSNSSRDSPRKFHVYTAPDFAHGRGISIITTEDRIARFRRIKLAPGVNDMSSPPPFEKRDIPGKGRGLVATKMIHRGDRIFAHTPLLVIDAQLFDQQEGEDKEPEWRALQEEAVAGLPAASQGMFWELYGQPAKHPVGGRVDANSFDLVMGDYETVYYGLFPETSRINHDCRPNLAYFFNNNTLTHHVHAITDIPPGAELTITYIDTRLPRRLRLNYLHRTWGFNCTCSHCSLDPALARASDKRLAQIRDLLERFAVGAIASSPAAADRLVSLFLQERLHAPAAEAYAIAAMAHCLEGRYSETLRWGNLALEAAMLNSGPHSGDVSDLERLLEEPEKHECWLAGYKTRGPGIWDDNDDEYEGGEFGEELSV
ncbi:hypothetical protein E4U55_007900 [Claviceps digitariae]|nr:hypothetical protein E4U55_007900 [Claviceps digitariae]